MKEVGAATVDQVQASLASAGLPSSSWSNGPGDRYAPHRHDYDKVLVAASGSITFDLPELGERVDLHAGDRLDLPAGTLHGAFVGPDGVTCLEAHLGKGALTRPPLHVRGWAVAAPPNETKGAPGA